MTLEILLPVAWSLDFSVLDMASHQVAGYLCQEVTVASRGPLRKVLLGARQQDTPHYRNTCRQGALRSSSHLTWQGLSPVGAGREAEAKLSLLLKSAGLRLLRCAAGSSEAGMQGQEATRVGAEGPSLALASAGAGRTA